MGGAFSRNDNNNHGPQGNGLYFGNQFTMGNATFQTMTPESFLFGDVAELAWLSRVPGSVPRVPPNVKHTNTVRCLVNVQKDTIKLVRHSEGDTPLDEYHLTFNLDSDVPCQIIIHQFVREEQDKMGNVTFKQYKRTRPLASKSMPAGYNQTFDHPELALTELSKLNDAELTFQATDDLLQFPLAIEVRIVNTPPLVTRDPDHAASVNHSQLTYLSYEKGNDSFTAKVLAQKVNVDGRSFLLREIYGMEQKSPEADTDDSDDDDGDTECVVCMSESMDTMVLPCRHLCLCNGCADVLRYQASKCPICRAPFHSLLQIQVAKREEDLSEEVLEATQEQEDTPRGYRMVPVVDALKAKGGSTGGGYIDVADDASDGNEQTETTSSAAAVVAEASASSTSSEAAAAVAGEDLHGSKVNPLYGKATPADLA